jgi:2-methylcitrate dehydratase PrpD
MTLVRRIAEYAVELEYDRIPAEALQLAKWVMFDTLGTGLGGYQRELGQKASRFGLLQMPGSQATLLGSGERSSMEGAAFANGVMTKILGMDDSHRFGGHIASQVIPAVLATSEVYQTSGREILVAIIAAYDVAIRIANQVYAAQRARGLDLKGTVGTLAAAVAAARCAGRDVETMVQALALAADMASGTEQYVYEAGKCDTKDLIAGLGARNGIFALKLALSGFCGPQGALDGEYGFFRAFGRGEYDASIFDDLGEDFLIMSTAFKPHGGCRHTHQAIDAARQIRQQHAFDTADIERIHIATYSDATRPVFRVNPDPQSRDVAGLSIRVSTAIALTYGQAFPQDFAHWDDPEIRRLRHITDVTIDPTIEANYPSMNGCQLAVTLHSGAVHKVFLPNMKGEPEFRMTEDEMVEKFNVLTRALLDEERVSAILYHCNHLESADTIQPLLSACSSRQYAAMMI